MWRRGNSVADQQHECRVACVAGVSRPDTTLHPEGPPVASETPSVATPPCLIPHTHRRAHTGPLSYYRSLRS